MLELKQTVSQVTGSEDLLKLKRIVSQVTESDELLKLKNLQSSYLVRGAVETETNRPSY